MVAGGFTSLYTSSVLALLPGAPDWIPLPSLPRFLASAQASIVGGRLRVTGGQGPGSYKTEVIAHDDSNWSFLLLQGHPE